jgi:glycosyltransferase involved in cell wall biosynthesis
MSRLKSLAWRYLLSADEVVRNLLLPSALQQQADIVVAHDLPTLPAAAAAAERLGAKLVYDSHELYCEQELEPRLRRLWREIERRYIQLCDAVITVNPSVARELQSRYGLALVHVVQNAVPYAAKPEKSRLLHEVFALDCAAAILLFQGGLLAGRHLETLVEAMRFVAAPSIHLVFLGDGPLCERLRWHCVRHSVAERVHFHPAVPQRELLRYTASADLGIIPYQATCLNNRYCTPNKLFEYVVAGLPMIATDLPELRRLIVGNGIGIVADTGSPQGIARALDGLLAEPMQLKAMQAQVLEARRRLNWEAESKVLVEVFRGLRTNKDAALSDSPRN